MNQHLPSLDALKVFEAAARHLSFSRAAQELFITKGAVSYQIKKLESGLDCALFRRTVRQVYLTNAGQELMQVTQRLFADLNRTLEQIKPSDSQHDVLVGATTYVAMRWLSPRISKFSERHPEISILLQHTVNSEDFSIQDVDFAIRWGRIEQPESRRRLLQLSMPLFPVCSPKLLQRHNLSPDSRLLSASDLADAALNQSILLCEDRSLDLWQAWYGDQPLSLDNPRRIIADANVRTQAAIDGQGWTMADQLMQHEIESGALIAPFQHQLNGFGYAIETASGRFISESARNLRQWLIDNA
ncbi:MAG: LysR family transcriptional regulator [Pseudomonadota bacterium]